jgi:hypothetical protein
MVHDAADVLAGPASLDSVRVRFDEQRLISDAGLLVTATLADRLGIEELVNESVWLGYGVPGAALPGRKVMSLVHGMLAGADSIDDMNVLRAGSTGLVLGHRVMAPSTLGTFLRAFTFGHVRQLDHVLDTSLARAWDAGGGPGELPLVIDVDSFVGEVHGDHKQGASYGYTRQLGYHPIAAVRADTGEVLHIRNRKGKANTQRGAARFVDELLARIRRAGHTGQVVIRADSGFENHKLMRALDRQGVEFSIGVKQSKTIRALIAVIPDTDWVTVQGLPRHRRGSDRRNEARCLAADRQADPPRRRAGRAVPRLAPPLLRDQPHRSDARRRYRSPRPRHDRARDPRPQGPGTGALPVRPIRGEQRVDRDRRARAQPRTLGNPDRSPRSTSSDRPLPPPTPAPDPRPPDPHQPPVDTPNARPLAMAKRLHHHSGRDPRPPRPHLTFPPRDEDQPTRRQDRHRSPLPENPAETLPQERQGTHHHQHRHHNRPNTPSTARTDEIHLTHADDRWFQAKAWACSRRAGVSNRAFRGAGPVA